MICAAYTRLRWLSNVTFRGKLALLVLWERPLPAVCHCASERGAHLVASFAKLTAMQTDPNFSISSCSTQNVHGIPHLIPCSRFSEDELLNAIDCMTSAIKQLPATLPSSTYYHNKFDVEAAQASSSILRIPASRLKAMEFRYYLGKRMPFVITGLNGELQLPWSPLQLMREYGTELCTVEDCEGTTPTSRQSLSDFLKMFLEYPGVPQGSNRSPIWKVKVRV